MQSNTTASPPATQQPRQYKPPQQRMPKKAGRNIEAISLNILAEPVMKEMKSSEVKGVRRLESRETVGAPVFLKLGQPLSSNPIRDMLRGPSGRPRGWEAAPESKVRWSTASCLVWASRGGNIPSITSSWSHTAEATIYVTRVSQCANLAWTGLKQVVSPGTREKQVQALSDPGLKVP